VDLTAYTIETAERGVAAAVYDFLFHNGQVHQDLDRSSFVEWWQSRFFDHPAGVGWVLIARGGSGQLVAHYAVLPFAYRAEGRKLTGGFICQLFVDSRYRATTLFYELERKLLQEFAGAGFDFLYGLITIKPVLQAHLALGFTKGQDLHVYGLPLAPGTLARAARFKMPVSLQTLMNAGGRMLARAALPLMRRVAGALPVELIPADSLDGALLEPIQAQWLIAADRSAIADRVRPFGNKKYEIYAALKDGCHSGYMILRRMQIREFNATVVVDVLAADSKTRRSLLLEAGKQGIHHGSDVVMCLAAPNSQLARTLRKTLFVRTPEFFTIVCDKAHREMLSSWHASWFDHDYV